MNKITILLALALFTVLACQNPDNGKLPILGERYFENGDTIYHTVPEFEFTDQNGDAVTRETFSGKIYIADFFFISCPTICPKVKKQMLRVYEEFNEENDLMFISHSIDPKRDTVQALKLYADNLGIDHDKWKFVTGVKDSIYEIADDYFSVAIENPDAPGGFDHSGRLILVDKNKHVRSFCNGTDPKDVDRFMKDVKKLLQE